MGGGAFFTAVDGGRLRSDCEPYGPPKRRWMEWYAEDGQSRNPLGWPQAKLVKRLMPETEFLRPPGASLERSGVIWSGTVWSFTQAASTQEQETRDRIAESATQRQRQVAVHASSLRRRRLPPATSIAPVVAHWPHAIIHEARHRLVSLNSATSSLPVGTLPTDSLPRWPRPRHHPARYPLGQAVWR